MTPVYKIAASAAGGDFEDDEVVTVGGGDLSGSIVVRVNDEPLTMLSRGGVLTSINHWMAKGENQCSIERRHGKPVFVKIARFQGDVLESIVAKKVFEPTEVEAPRTLRWDAQDVADAPHRVPLPPDPESRKQIESQLAQRVADIGAAIAKRDGATVASELNAGTQIWGKVCYGLPDEVLAAKRADCVRQFSRAELKLVGEDVPPQFLYGRTVVMVWSGRSDVSSRPYAVRYTTSGGSGLLDALHFAKVDGRWLVWE